MYLNHCRQPPFSLASCEGIGANPIFVSFILDVWWCVSSKLDFYWCSIAGIDSFLGSSCAFILRGGDLYAMLALLIGNVLFLLSSSELEIVLFVNYVGEL